MANANPVSRKGKPNWDSRAFREEMQRACDLRGFELIGSIVEDAQSHEDASIRMQAKKLLVDYSYPKLRAVEVTNPEPVEVIITDEAAKGA